MDIPLFRTSGWNGSLAAIKDKFSRMSALGRIADVLDSVFRAARIE